MRINGIILFLEYLGESENKILHLFNSSIVKAKNYGEEDISSLPGVSQKNSKMEIEDCSFPWEGSYEIKVYKYDEVDDLESDNDTSTRKMMRYMDKSHLVSIYPFKVQFE